MTRTTMVRVSLAVVMMAAPVAFLATPASASGTPPTKWCGAQNMIVASPVFTDYFGGGVTVSSGMDTAMGVDAEQGNAGMFTAVGNSFANAQSPTCPG